MNTATIRIDLLRHGATTDGAGYRGRTDDPLSAAGLEQMWAAIEGRASWRRIVSSPLQRCQMFARAVAARRGLALEVDARLRELDFGLWEGRTAEELLLTEPDALERFWRDPWRNAPRAGESLRSLHARVLAAWSEIVDAAQATLVVTHGGPIRVILCHWRRLPLDRLLDIDVPLASLHSIEPESAERRSADAIVR